MSVEDISREVYLGFAEKMRHVVDENPICQLCGKSPSVRITRWGPIKAACGGCLEEELRRFEEYCEERRKEDDA